MRLFNSSIDATGEHEDLLAAIAALDQAKVQRKGKRTGVFFNTWAAQVFQKTKIEHFGRDVFFQWQAIPHSLKLKTTS